MVGYTQKVDPQNTSRAIGLEQKIPSKKAIEVCTAIRGMDVTDATLLLEDVIEKKRPIPYKKHMLGTAAKRGKRMGPAGYPVKAAKAILKVLHSAQQNAEYKGLNSENMVIQVAAAHRGQTYQNYMPRAHGRATPFFRETTNIEIILKMVEE